MKCKWSTTISHSVPNSESFFKLQSEITTKEWFEKEDKTYVLFLMFFFRVSINKTKLWIGIPSNGKWAKRILSEFPDKNQIQIMFDFLITKMHLIPSKIIGTHTDHYSTVTIVSHVSNEHWTSTYSNFGTF